MTTTTNAEVLDLLRRARARIADPAHWTTHIEATDAVGLGCKPDDPCAVRWCALRALVAEGVHYSVQEAAWERLRDSSVTGSPASVNDDLGHAAVLAMYDQAIEALEAEG